MNLGFNIRSVESCTAASYARAVDLKAISVSIFALSNRVLLPRHPLQQGLRLDVFQYSLCRIVYCCLVGGGALVPCEVVSIFALSNRVLLPTMWAPRALSGTPVSIFALSNRVLLPEQPAGGTIEKKVFQYSLCRIVYCCHHPAVVVLLSLGSFNIRSVESCTAAPILVDEQFCVIDVSIFALSNRVLLPVTSPGGGASNAQVSIFALSNRVLLPHILWV